MPTEDQVLRFAVGSPDGPRSPSWRLWVPRGKSDVYVSGRTLGSAVKVSLHEPGPARCAMTKDWVRRTCYRAPVGRDSRLAVTWERPRPRVPLVVARSLSIIVPFDEVQDRRTTEKGGAIVWVSPPPHDTCIHFDVIHVPANAKITSHPGAQSMGTSLVGEVQLENGEHVFVTSIVRPIGEQLRDNIAKLRNYPILDADGKRMNKTGMLSFGTESNPDTNDGTEIGVLLAVTRPIRREP